MCQYGCKISQPADIDPMRQNDPSPLKFNFRQRAFTPIAYVEAILGAYDKYGHIPSEALAAAQIKPEQLNDPTARITALQFELLSGFAMQELDDEALGWFSRRLPWGTYGMLCRASLTSPTLEIALKRWCRHHFLITQDVVLRLGVKDGVVTLELQERADLSRVREFCHVTLLRYLLGFASWAVLSKITLDRASFAFPAPTHSDIYPGIFTPSLNFDAQTTQIVFDARYLALPVQRDEGDLNKMLKRALPLTILPYRGDRLLVERVSTLLRQSHAKFPTAEKLAETFNTSTRSLHRRLADEQSSLREIKEKVRREIALDILQRTNKPIKAASTAAGFANEKSFARAVRQWTGHSPSEYRRRQVGR